MPAGAETTPLELIDSTNITFANLFDYRVSRNVIPHLAAVEATRSNNIRFANVHDFSMTRLAFDDSVMDTTRNVAVRTHDFTSFVLDDAVKLGAPLPTPAVFTTGATLERLTPTGTFSNIAGFAEDAQGRLFFTDSAAHKVLRWDEETKAPVLVTDSVPTPMVLGYAGNDTLLAIDYSKAVYAIATKDGHAQKLSGESSHDGTTLLIPTAFHFEVKYVQWMVGHQGVIYAGRSNMAISGMDMNEPRSFFYAPGTSTAIKAGGDWKGLLQTTQLASFRVGQSRYGVSEEADKVYKLTLDTLDRLSAEPFIPRPGTAVVRDTKGNFYVAGAQLFIYSPLGKPLGTLEIPERPGSLAFGGKDHRTLYIGARTALYSIRTAEPGE
jgi:sugar lactone lactonase YvrE